MLEHLKLWNRELEKKCVKSLNNLIDVVINVSLGFLVHNWHGWFVNLAHRWLNCLLSVLVFRIDLLQTCTWLQIVCFAEKRILISYLGSLRVSWWLEHLNLIFDQLLILKHPLSDTYFLVAALACFSVTIMNYHSFIFNMHSFYS
jgi:hypothetical protein